MLSLARTGCVAALLAAVAALAPAPAQELADDNTTPDGVEVETRGPVHEAYAQPHDRGAEPGDIVPKEPPPPITEEPPDYRPEGPNVQWIPGYWAWDAERNDYLWVSGTYRNAPAGRQWVPGHWVRSGEGWRWVPGFWAGTDQKQVPYTPEPPAPLDNDPNIPPPDDDSTWVPGYWNYRESRFAWRPGYWAPCYAGRVWVAPRHVWTPSGYLFVDGYWDMPFEERGLLFAPVWFSRPLWANVGFCYRPWNVVNFGLFYDSCFARRGSFHFYFGNYYGRHCWDRGFRPWFHGHRHDSSFAHHHWRNHRGDHRWLDGQQSLYEARRDGKAPVPPLNLAQQRGSFRNDPKIAAVNNVSNVKAVAPLTQAKALNNNVKLVNNTATQADILKRQALQTRETATLRNKLDTGAVKTLDRNKGLDNSPRVFEARSFKLPAPAAGLEGRTNDGVTIRSGNSLGETRGSDSFKDRLIDSNKDRGDGDKGTPRLFTRPSDNNAGSVTTSPSPLGNRPAKSTEYNFNAPGSRNGTTNSKSTGSTPPILRGIDNASPNSAIAPKTFSGNSSSSIAPRTDAPKFSAPQFSAPKVVNPSSAPRINVPSSAPSFNPPSAPRINVPSSAPRINVPSSAPRINTPSAPRINVPSSAPRINSAPSNSGSRSLPSRSGSSSRSSSSRSKR